MRRPDVKEQRRQENQRSGLVFFRGGERDGKWQAEHPASNVPPADGSELPELACHCVLGRFICEFPGHLPGGALRCAYGKGSLTSNAASCPHDGRDRARHAGAL